MDHLFADVCIIYLPIRCIKYYYISFRDLSFRDRGQSQYIGTKDFSQAYMQLPLCMETENIPV